MNFPTWLVAVACLIVFGCVAAMTMPPSIDVTGTWAGAWVGHVVAGNGPVTMTLQQAGGKVTGDVVLGGGSPYSGPVSGTVSADVLSISYRGGTGEFTIKGNEMIGSTPFSRWTLKRQ